MAGWEGFTGINRGYVLELYERFRRDPASVDPETRAVTRAGKRLANHHQPVGILVRERAEQNCVNYAEDRGVRTDPQTQCENSNHCKGGMF